MHDDGPAIEGPSQAPAHSSIKRNDGVASCLRQIGVYPGGTFDKAYPERPVGPANAVYDVAREFLLASQKDYCSIRGGEPSSLADQQNAFVMATSRVGGWIALQRFLGFSVEGLLEMPELEAAAAGARGALNEFGTAGKSATDECLAFAAQTARHALKELNAVAPTERLELVAARAQQIIKEIFKAKNNPSRFG